MALNCDLLDGKLKALEDAKAAMKEKLGELSSQGSAALADIKSAADAQLDALKSSLPEVPEIPNFQSAFDEVKTKVLGNDPNADKIIEKFQGEWGGAVDDIASIIITLNNPLTLLKFNPCSLPKIDAEKLADGTFKALPTPPESPKLNKDVEDMVEPSEAPTAIDKKVSTSDIAGHDLTLSEVDSVGILLNTVSEKNENKVPPGTINSLVKEVYGKQRKKVEQDILNVMPKETQKYYKTRGINAVNYFLETDVPIPESYDNYYSKLTELRSLQYIKSTEGFFIRTISDFITNEEGKTDENIEKLYSAYQTQIRLEPLGFPAIPPEKLTEGTQRYNRNLFNVKLGDFRSIFIGRSFTLSDIRTGTEGRVINAYQDNLIGIARAIFRDKEIYQSYIWAKAQRNQTLKKETTINYNYQDILPEDLGGNLTPLNAPRPAAAGVYTRATFVPHVMYRDNADTKGILAYDYDKHLQLARDGYIHK